MAKLSIVIVDSDEAYAEGLINYLTDNYSHKFKVSYFTTHSFLKGCLSEEGKSIDILLISPELYESSLPVAKVNTVILLSNGRLEEVHKNYNAINKFQIGDKLVGNILKIYSEKNPGEIQIQNDNKRTKIVGVYSPVGGSGKTSIAVGIALQCANRGMAVFYLNFEGIASTSLFFDSQSDQNLSNILLLLKDKIKNLNLKIESTRAIDLQTGIHYFAPPESVFEYEEISPDEIKYLIEQIKQMGCYDAVVIDMSSNLNSRNMAVLEACDEVFTIITQEPVSVVKTGVLIKELDMMLGKRGINLNEKLTFILNKCDLSILTHNHQELGLGDKGVSFRIPKVVSLINHSSGRNSLNLNNNFGEAIKGLVNKIQAN